MDTFSDWVWETKLAITDLFKIYAYSESMPAAHCKQNTLQMIAFCLGFFFYNLHHDPTFLEPGLYIQLLHWVEQIEMIDTK